MKQSSLFFITNTLIVFSLTSCAPISTQITPIHTNTSVANNHPEATNTSISTIAPTLTATSIPAATVEIKCPSLNPDIQFNYSEDPTKLEALILNYLNEGGDPEKIALALLPQTLPNFHIAAADINGDSLPEVIVSTQLLFEKKADSKPTIRIYQCKQNEYTLARSFKLDLVDGYDFEYVTDIFPNEPLFMIIRVPHIAGWGEDFYAVGWRNSEWQLIYLGTGLVGSDVAFFDQNGDGIKEFYMKTGRSSKGADREIVDIYSWNGKEFILIDEKLPPGNDRIHYLEDAESVRKQGNPLLAVTYYEIAARDSSLNSFWTDYEWEYKQTRLAKPYQQAFAFFRIVATWLYLGRPDIASQYIQEMSDAFPQGKPGNEFVQAAQELSDGYKKDPDFFTSCAKAVNFLDEHYPDIVRHHLNWGSVDSMYYATDDICEFK
jgi:hypothetical protein